MSSGKYQPRHSWKWRTGALIAVHVAIVAHVAHWLVNGRTLGGVGPDAAMELGKHDIVNVGLVVFIVLILATAVFGRFFCGWGCHLVALQDLCRWLLLKIGIRPRPLRSRLLALVPIIACVYMFFWPAVYRWATDDSFGEITTVWTTTNLWAGLPGWVVGSLTLVTCGFLIVYVLGSKGFCTYACPYGAVFGFADRLAPIRVRVTDACRNCARCTAGCTSNVRVHEQVRDFGMVTDPGCMKCLDCVGGCPNHALHLGAGRPALAARPLVGCDPTPRRWNVGWAEEVLLAAGFTGAFLSLRGLYGHIPFLMSLGVSAMLAYLGLMVVRLVTRDDFGVLGHRLRQTGKLTRKGWVFTGLATLIVLFWGHSAVIRALEWAGDRDYRRTIGLRTATLELDRPLYLARGDDREHVERAIANFERGERWGLVANPRTPLKLAWLHLLAGHPDDFAAHITAAVESQGQAAEVHLLRGREAVAASRFSEAVEAYGTAVEREPRNPVTHLGLGTVLAGIGDLEEAAAVFVRGIEALPDSAALHYNLGVARALQGRLEESVSSFEAAIDLDPDHLEAKENLGAVLAMAGRR